MPEEKERASYYLIRRDGVYHVFCNEKPNGFPTGRTANTYADGMKIIAELESEAKSAAKPKVSDVLPKKCPKCGAIGDIEAVFGFRKMNGVLRPQSQCRNCRSSGKQEKEASFTVDMIPDAIDAELTQGASVDEPGDYHSTSPRFQNPVRSVGEATPKYQSSIPSSKKKEPTHLRDCTSEDADKAIRLFKFLRNLTLLRSKTVRTLDKYKVIWLGDFPKASGCFSVFEVPEDERSELILSVEQPSLTEVPSPSAFLEPWVDLESLKKSNTEPVLKSKIGVTKNIEISEGESDLEFRLLDDNPSIKEKWATYLQEEWKPWSGKNVSESAVLSAYEDLYDIFQTVQKVAENWELLLSIGVLAWKTPSQQVVCRHILTARVNISFDTIRGVIELTAPPEGLKFQLEQDMLELSERPASHHREQLGQLLNDLNEASLTQSEANKFLQSWMNALSPRGQYKDDTTPFLAAYEDPHLTFAPAIIFRQRTERNLVRLFEEIIESIEECGKIPFGIERLVRIVDDGNLDGLDDRSNSKEDDEIYFPLEANPDQREIAEKLRTRQGVLVQGPPGTGKSHTIANLVCHLLATGKRILVTSHTPRALTVLREKFPHEMKALCVSVIGDDNTSTRKALEESVSGITSKRNSFNKNANLQKINDLTKSIDDLRQSEAWTLNALRGIREADTYNHPTKFVKYSGTTQSIARRVRLESERNEWLLVEPDETCNPPLSNEEAVEFLTACRTLTVERIEELQRFMLEPSELPEPAAFTELISNHKLLESRSEKLESLKSHPAFPASVKLEKTIREELASAVGNFINTYQRLLNRRESWATKAAHEIVSDRDRSWRKLYSMTNERLALLAANRDAVTSANVTGLGNRDLQSVRTHALALRDHLERKRGLGFGPFRPAVVKDAIYLLKETRVGDEVPCNCRALTKLLNWIDYHRNLDELRELWKGIAEFSSSNPELLIGEIEDSCEPLETALSLHEQIVSLREALNRNPGLAEPAWDDLTELVTFKEVLESGQIEERLHANEDEIHTLATRITAAASHPKAHSLMIELRDSVEKHDSDGYHSAFNRLQVIGRSRQKLKKKGELGQKLALVAPELASEVEHSCDEIFWDERLAYFEDAWNWARAKKWVQKVSDPKTQKDLANQLETAQREIRKALGQLAAEKAWKHTFERLTEAEHSHLIAWEMAMRRIGKGTGKYAEKNRKDARKHMDECRSAIPAWIIPIHKVVETTKLGGEPFDVVIVDEASQSGPEALFLMYIAKQIVVVGDDKQISPEFVGQNREEVDILREEFLKDVPFSDALGVEHSFFDQAKIRYRGTIRLKEHFRCMPEIIQFSNNLCYTDDPLIPLRQYGAGRLNPVVRTTYVQNGYSDEDSRKPVNTVEAEAIIEQIRVCCQDPAYEGKTIGVISLLNSSGQAEYIEKQFRLRDILSKEELELRKFRVGDSYVFQGDERDIIFLSMVSAPRPDGKKVWPMTAEKDHRRFNVAASRARDQVWLFHSVSLSDLNPKCIRFNMLEYYSNPNVATVQAGETDIETLKRDLASAYNGSGTPQKPFDSWFEVDVFLRLAERGYRVVPQYSMNGYSIDLVVEGLKGRLAVECDGDYWHGMDRYDHDMARQRDLERCGMQFWRVRGSAFYLNPEKALEDLWSTLDKLKIFPNLKHEEAFASESAEQ